LTASADEAGALLAPYDGEMRAYRVSQAVNDPANDAPEVAEPLEG
jgi:putative SOS response-associated peptidase YedK